MIGFTNCLSTTLFVPTVGKLAYAYIAGSILIGLLFLFMLTKVPNRWRKPIVMGVTFVAGWFYFIEFIIPSSSEMVVVRKETVVAERLIRRAANDLGVIEKRVAERKKGRPLISPSASSTRTANADKALGSALVHLNKIKSELERTRPKFDGRINVELKKAAAFAKSNHLTEAMVERKMYNGESVIVNEKVKALMKRSNDTRNAYESITKPFPPPGEKGTPGAIALVESVKSQLGGVTQSGSNLAGSLTEAAEKTAGARTSAIADNFLSPYKLLLASTLQVVGSFAFALGLFSLFTIHGKAIAKKRKGRHNSVAFFVAIATMAILGLLKTYTAAGSSFGAVSRSAYDILFNGGLTALQSTMFSLVAFYIVSAAYRAFRIRSMDAVIMMVSAFLVMLSVVPIGMWMTSGLSGDLSFLKLENIGDWIMTVPNMAAQRGMQFGITVGGLAMALRIWLSLERGSYFDKQM